MMSLKHLPAPCLNHQVRQKIIDDNITELADTGSVAEVQEPEANAPIEEAPNGIKRRKFPRFLLTLVIILSIVGSISSLFIGCKNYKEVNIERGYDFLEHLEEAQVVTPEKRYVRRDFFTIGKKAKEVLFEHPPSQVMFSEVFIHKDARLTFGIGMDKVAWWEGREGDGVLFEIIITDDKSQQHPIYSRYIDPKNNFEDRKWFDETIDLKSFQGQKVSFTFKTSCGPKNCSWDWAGWGNPQVVPIIKRQVPNTRKSNVILISIDTLRADHLGCYGYEKNTTPNLDKFAREGIQFMNAFAQFNSTLPSHISILTSLYPDVHGVMNKESCLDSKYTTMAEILRKSGYITAGFVRACVWMDAKFGFDQGFHLYSVSPDNAQQINKKIFSWLKKHKNETFFLFVHYYDVHSDFKKLPYDSPPPYNRMFLPDYKGDFSGCGEEGICASIYLLEIARKGIILPPEDRDYIRGMYDGGIRYTDTQVGELLKKIDGLGLRENTLVVITSDHGEEFQEHKKFIHDQIYNETLSVPLLMRFPGRIPTNKKNYHRVESIDILPTILNLLDIDIPHFFQGKSLNTLINGNQNWQKPLVFANGKWQFRTVIKDKWKLIYHLPTKNKELYDLEKDPSEKVNKAGSHKDKVDIMMTQLQEWMKVNKAWRKRFMIGKTKRRDKLTKKEIEKLKSLGYLQ